MGIKSEVTKYDLYQIISSKDDLARHIPPTGLFDDLDDVISFIEDYGKVILRPINYSKGEGMLIIEKLNDNFKITDCRRKSQVKSILDGVEELKSFFKKSENNLHDFLFQKLIKSVRIEQSPFDLKVVMKKGLQGCWECGEMEYTIGGKHFLLMNVYKEVYPALLSEALKKTYPLKFDFHKIIRKINKLCIITCETIDSRMDYSGNVEFKIAIDEENKPWFLEINLIKTMKKFKIVDYNAYSSIKGSSILYSTSAFCFEN
jgi:hypothetical protein